MNLKAMKERSRLLHQNLNQKNDYRMTEVIRYLRGKDLSTRQIETLRLELLEKATQAQAQGKAADSAFNYDYRTYIDQLAETIPAMSPAEQRYESFRLWGILILALGAISILTDLASHYLSDGDGPLRWTVNGFEAILILLITGISAIVSSLFTRRKLERDPDFFSKKAGNLFFDFLGTYGFSLIWLVVCLILMYFFRDAILLDVSMAAAAVVFAVLAILYGLILNFLRNKAWRA